MSDKFNIFGRNHTVVGELSSDLLLRTSGKIKIQFGNKFIDLIKDLKINADLKFIYVEDSVGTKDGIYVTKDSVTLVANGNPIELIGTSGNTYVSFLNELNTSSELKSIALKNIGLLYDSIEEYEASDGIKNGIVFIDNKLYTIIDGSISELKMEIPNPYPKQFIILKEDNKQGALVIKGNGIENSLAFDSLYIYSDTSSNTIQSDKLLNISLENITYLTIGNNKVVCTKTFTSDGIQSPNFNLGNNGYSIYLSGNKWVLEIDKVIERDALEDELIHNIPYYLTWNIISNWDSENLTFTTLLPNSYKVGDTLEISGIFDVTKVIDEYEVTDQDGNVTIKLETLVVKEFNTFKFNIVDISEDGIITINSLDIPDIEGRLVYAVDGYLIIRIKDNIDLLNDNNVHTRIGNLKGIKSLNGLGIYSELAYFKKAEYTSDYNLPDDDNSSKFASTEWVKRQSSNTVDIDFSITTPSVDIIEYFNRMDIRKLAINQEFDTVVTYVGKYGMITIDKNSTVMSYSAIVRAKNSKDLWSHRTINADYYMYSSIWRNTSTYIIDEIFIPGYYWSSVNNNGKPESPIYIGTDKDTVTEDKPYLWYSNDGETWTLIEEYVPENEEYYYFASSLRRYYDSSVLTNKHIPAGFLTWVDSNGVLLKNIGASNWLSVLTTYDNDSESVLRWPDEVKNMIDKIGTPKVGVKPNTSGYTVLWIIPVSDWSSRKYDPTAYQEIVITNSSIKHESLQQTELLPLYTNLKWASLEGNRIRITKNTDPLKNIGTEEFWTDPYSLTTYFGIIFRDWLLHGNLWGNRNYKDQIYSENTGWAIGYENISIINKGVIGLYGSGMLEPVEPSDETGSFAIPHPRFTLNFIINYGTATITGSSTWHIGSFKRINNPDDEKYLVSFSEGVIGSVQDEKISLPELINLAMYVTFLTNNEQAIRKTITWYGGKDFYVKNLNGQ